MSGLQSCTVFAPGTVANIASGFDILGFAISGIGDRITVSKCETPGVTIEPMTGVKRAHQIPSDPKLNTAGLPLLLMLKDLNLNFGLTVKIEKGIPLGSGMGGSAASSVGAVVAANHLIGSGLSKARLLEYSLEGEAVASGSKHADNVAPCLYGGLTLSEPGENPNVVALPYPSNLFCVVVHPEMELKTKDARAVLKSEILLKNHSIQSAYLAALVAGFCTSDPTLIARGLQDILIEPFRAPLIPGFKAVKTAALEAGALGCSISGAGPSLFAFANNEVIANRVATAMVSAFQDAGHLSSQAYVSPILAAGAYVL